VNYSAGRFRWSRPRGGKRACAGALLLLLATVWAIGCAPEAARSEGTVDESGASLLHVLEGGDALNFAVMAKIYPEDPSTLFVTTRRGGLSLYDLADPSRPALVTRWQERLDVEGQDRSGDLLVLIARTGTLFTFDVSEPGQLRPLGQIDLVTAPSFFEAIAESILRATGDPFRSLHTKLYRSDAGRQVALVSAPVSEELLAVDVSDPSEPKQIGAVDTGVHLIESIFVHRNHAFVGGFGFSDVYTAVDVTKPEAMRIAASLQEPEYRQLVSEMSPREPDLLYAALWDDPGGLAIFDVSEPARFHEVGSVVSAELAHANRVKLQGHFAFLPLEQDPGGFAVLDVRSSASPRVVTLVRNVPGVSVPYTLAVNGPYLYLFGTRESTLAVFRLDVGDARTWETSPEGIR
jgi:hypothetical protein